MKVCAFLTDGFETVEGLAVVDILRRADIKIDMISITGDINVKSAQGVIVQADELFAVSAPQGPLAMLSTYGYCTL